MFVCGDKTAIGTGFRPTQLALPIELTQEGAPGFQPDILLFPSAQASPTGTG